MEGLFKNLLNFFLTVLLVNPLSCCCSVSINDETLSNLNKSSCCSEASSNTTLSDDNSCTNSSCLCHEYFVVDYSSRPKISIFQLQKQNSDGVASSSAPVNEVIIRKGLYYKKLEFFSAAPPLRVLYSIYFL
jgi:hypothetical protein